MADMADTWKGLRCPTCGEVENFSVKGNTKDRDCLFRRRECKSCGTVIKTAEVPIETLSVPATS